MTKRTSQVDQWQDPAALAVPASRLRLVLTDDDHWALGTAADAAGHIVDAGDTQVIDDTVTTGKRLAATGGRTTLYE